MLTARHRDRPQGPEGQGNILRRQGGTKIRIIRVVDGDHNIDCRIDGIGQMGQKSEFVKKA
jgi:protein PhnA